MSSTMQHTARTAQPTDSTLEALQVGSTNTNTNTYILMIRNKKEWELARRKYKRNFQEGRAGK